MAKVMVDIKEDLRMSRSTMLPRKAADMPRKKIAMLKAHSVADLEKPMWSAISWLNGLNVREGVFEEANYGGKVVKEYEAAIGKDDILKQVDALQRRADDLQDALDEFNASNKVEIEVDG